MKNKTKHIRNWDDLIDFVEQTNPYKQTIILTGFINRLDGDRLVIDHLIFEQRSLSVLKKQKKKLK